MADDKHDRLPDEGDIKHVPFAGDGVDNCGGDFVRGPQIFPTLHPGGHGGADRAGLDGEDGDAFAVDAISQAGEEADSPALEAIEVVRFAAAVAGDRGDHREDAGVALDAEVGQPGEQRDRRDEVGVDDLRGVWKSCSARAWSPKMPCAR